MTCETNANRPNVSILINLSPLLWDANIQVYSYHHVVNPKWFSTIYIGSLFTVSLLRNMKYVEIS